MKTKKLAISAEGLKTLTELGQHLTAGAEHIEAANSLLLKARESDHLSVFVDLVEGELEPELPAPAVVDGSGD